VSAVIREAGHRERCRINTVVVWEIATECRSWVLPKVATEMALHVLAYNLTRVMNIMGPQPLMAAIRA
jgi:hypothetical protein